MSRACGVAVLLVLSMMQGCHADGSDRSPLVRHQGRIRVLATNSAVLGVPRVPGRHPLVIGWVNVCLESGAPQRIQQVRAVGADHARVLDFALRDNPAWSGGDTYAGGDVELDWPVGLDEAGFDREAKTVSLVCEKNSGRAHQLGIEIETTEPSRSVGVIESFEVVWSGGQETIPLTVLLCPFESASDPRCQDALPE